MHKQKGDCDMIGCPICANQAPSEPVVNFGPMDIKNQEALESLGQLKKEPVASGVREWLIEKKLKNGINRAFDIDSVEGDPHNQLHYHVVEYRALQEAKAELLTYHRMAEKGVWIETEKYSEQIEQLVAKDAEINRLVYELDKSRQDHVAKNIELQKQNDQIEMTCQMRERQIAAEKERSRKLLGALEKYANKKYWREFISDPPGDVILAFKQGEDRPWIFAQEALAEFEKAGE